MSRNSTDGVILTTTNNSTIDGVSFPSTPKPQVIFETFASYSPKDKITIDTISDFGRFLVNHNFKNCDIYVNYCDFKVYLKFGFIDYLRWIFVKNTFISPDKFMIQSGIRKPCWYNYTFFKIKGGKLNETPNYY